MAFSSDVVKGRLEERRHRLKKMFQREFYISAPDYPNGMEFFVQIDPDENLY